MLSVVIDVHRNILSAQCYIKYNVRKTPANNLQILCMKNSLLISIFYDDELYKEIKILTPDNFFIPNSVSREQGTSCLVELERDSFRIFQKSHYSKYRKVIERYLENFETRASENANSYKRLKIDAKDGFVEDYFTDSSLQELDYSERCLPVEDRIEISFRLQLSSSDVIPDSLMDPDSLLTLYEYFKNEVQTNIPYIPVCSYCCKALCSDALSFQNIKEFSNSLSDMSESWFCHKSVAPHSNMNGKTLYVSDAHIYLHSDILDSFSFETKESQVVCSNCCRILSCGEEFDSSRKKFKCFFGDSITFKKPDSLSNFTVDTDLQLKSAMLCLWSIINHKQMPLCRLFLQAKVEEEEDTCLLLWVPSVKVAQFKIRRDVNAMPRDVNFATEAVFKVKYHLGTLSSPLVVRWGRDFNVDFHRVSGHLMKTVVDILKSTSEYIPGGKTEDGGFFNGCLPCVPSLSAELE